MSAASLPSAEERLWGMILENQLSEAKQLLLDTPSLNINWGHPGFAKWTSLHNASSNGMPEFVKIFLRHPAVQVNALDGEGKTPFFHAANNTQLFALAELLQDPRVDVNRPDADGATPLWWAAFRGDAEVIKFMIASGRNIDVNAKTLRSPVPRAELAKLTPAEAAKKMGHKEAAALLDKFKAAPEKFRAAVKQQEGIPAMTVSTSPKFTAEGYVLYLQGKEVPATGYEQKQGKTSQIDIR